jgi:hypothetical protein
MKSPALNIHPDLWFEPAWILRCRVNILVVTDWNGGFGTQGFDLGHVLSTLDDDPWSHIEFRITKAHRQSSSTADLNGFEFHKHDLGQYSQIWLFGVHRNQGALKDEEVAAITQFMENGGGVFATGDHEDHGRALCGSVPRVRSMRRWHYPTVGPNGEPVAPAQTGLHRHDTVVSQVQGGNQSDDLPQPIRPRWYKRPAGGLFPALHLYPHPLLCGPDGVIEYLPDHMHEGVCEVPKNLDAPLLAGGSEKEYPTVRGVGQPLPQVIAWATSRNTDNREFGVIAAYDGHPIERGRVVVDATWHHWFNINLVGFVNASNPAHPSYDPDVIAKWASIQAYFRNVAVWLAHPSLQRCIRNGGWLWAIAYYDVQITFQDLRRVPDQLAYFWQLGTFARDALGRIAGRCQTTKWISDWLLELNLPIRLDPWSPFEDVPRLEDSGLPDTSLVETVALGAGLHGAMSQLAELTSEERAAVFERDGGNQVHQIMLSSSMDGFKALVDRIRQDAATASDLLGGLQSKR